MDNKEKSSDFTKAVCMGVGLGIAVSPIIKHIAKALPQMGNMLDDQDEPLQIGEHKQEEGKQESQEHEKQEHEKHDEHKGHHEEQKPDDHHEENEVQKALQFFREHHPSD